MAGKALSFLAAAAIPLAFMGAVHAHDMRAHHEPLVIPEDSPQRPQVEIKVLKDAVSGWNLHVMTSNFRFARKR